MRRINHKVPPADRSLATFVQALTGLKVVVELNNDSVARGILESSDVGMNLTLTEASVQPLQVIAIPCRCHMWNLHDRFCSCCSWPIWRVLLTNLK